MSSKLTAIRLAPSGGLLKPELDCHPESRYFDEKPFGPAHDIQYNGDGKRGPPIVMSFRRFIEASIRLGSRIYTLIQELESVGLQDEGKLMTSRTDRINSSPEHPFEITLLDIACPLAALQNPPIKEDLSQQRAIQLIQRQLVDESNRNWESVAPQFYSIWAYAASKEVPKEKFFSIQKWPLQLRTQAEMLPSRLKALKMGLTDRHADPENGRTYWDKRRSVFEGKETFYGGETVFPFGETKIQARILSNQFEEDLRDGTCSKSRPYLSRFENTLTLSSSGICVPL